MEHPLRKHSFSVSRFLSAAVILLSLTGGAAAQTLTEDNPMTFGTTVMRDNSIPQDLVMLPGGGYLPNPAYLVIDPPELGDYTITGQLPNHIMDIAINVGSTVLYPVGGGAPYFTVVNPFTVPPVVVTDGSGFATFQIGATLRSSGGPGGYLDDQYRDSYTITVTPQ